MEGDSTVAQPKSDSLEDLMTKVQSDIKNSDWLQKNTAEKWKEENPELAAEYLKALEKSREGRQSQNSSCTGAGNS